MFTAPAAIFSPPQGVGRRYAHVVLRKADIDLTKRAGELTEDEVSGDPRKPPELRGGAKGGHRHPPTHPWVPPDPRRWSG